MSFMEDFERWMKRVMKFFEEMEKEMLAEFERLERLSREPARFFAVGKPRVYYYGFEITIGPDGKPRIREFGNIRPRIVEAGEGKPIIEVQEDIEPLTDVIEENDKIKVIMDMPGVNKDNIKVTITEDGRKLIVSAKGEDRRYYKEVELPAPVDPTKAKATYRNGVLTIELEKKEKKQKGVDIKVE
ncbi:MAG: Hsp20/alpha crystallin family protein [Crenarchaeota archaeon]|nr:Hsp20/alpha crystallin family protein [Thermoproteota archaeon]